MGIEVSRKSRKEYNKEYYAKHRERLKERSKEYRAMNREQCREQKKEYRLINPGQIQENIFGFGRHRHMNENRNCSSFLGVYVAEQVLGDLFERVERAPYGNPGWDFKCGKGKLIDCKSGCLIHRERRSPSWEFNIKNNIISDYYLCIGFDDRKNLNPLHVWVIPGDLVNHLTSLGFANCDRSLSKWKQFEKPINNVIAGCQRMKKKAIT